MFGEGEEKDFVDVGQANEKSGVGIFGIFFSNLGSGVFPVIFFFIYRLLVKRRADEWLDGGVT